MIKELRFTPGRFARWMESEAKRAGISVIRLRLHIAELAAATQCHDDCIGERELVAAALNGSKHQTRLWKCWRCHALATLFRFFYASYAELQCIAGKRRADDLHLRLRVLEDEFLGIKIENEEASALTPEAKYASVGVYDPEEPDPDDDDAEESALERCFTLHEWLRLRWLPLYRKWHLMECGDDRFLARALHSVVVHFGLSRSRETAKRSKRRVTDWFKPRRKK